MIWTWRNGVHASVFLGLFILSGPMAARAQDASEVQALNRQNVQLHGQGKYAEAAATGEKVLALAERTLGKDHPDTLASINNLGAAYNALGRHAEAEPLYRRALAGRERVLGKEHPDTLASVNNLAALYFSKGRYGDAVPLLKHVVEVSERALGPEHPQTLGSINNLAMLYNIEGRQSEAEPLFRRVLEAKERLLGKEHPDTLITLNNLAALYYAQGRYAEAETLFTRALKISERVRGKEHPDTIRCLNNLALVQRTQGRYAEAEPLFKQALEAYERVLGNEHPTTLTSADNLASTYSVQGRHGEAEPLYKRVLEARERTLGRDHPDTLRSLNNLALLYDDQRRPGDAEPLFKRASETSERVLGKEHPDTLISLNNLASVYRAQERYAEAELLYRRVLDIRERTLGKEHPATLTSLNNLAMAYNNQGRHAQAEPLYRRALEMSERVLGKEHPETLITVNNLASLYQSQGRYGEAEPLFKRALAVREHVLGAEHPDTLASLNNLAMLHLIQRDWSGAAQFWRRSTAALAGRTLRGAVAAGRVGAGKQKSEAEQLAWQFSGLVKMVHRLGPPDETAAREMFQTAQWALSSEAAQSLTQMAARNAKGGGTLATLARDRQDLVAEWQRRDGERNAALGRDAAKRDAKAEAENASKLAAIDARIAGIDKRLAAEFPDYAALASPEPLSVADVQAQLGADEALVLFLDTDDRFSAVAPEETFIWVVTRTDMRWIRSGLGTKALAGEVQALRCGLDAAEWDNARCADLTGPKYRKRDRDAGRPLPFDHARAHSLYKALFGGVEDLIKDKHLLLVLSGPLAQLPFQVLVTAPPGPEADNKTTAWLARGHALTVLPAVSSLRALRRVARPSAATRPMIGFGNPLLDGNQTDPRSGTDDKELARLARDRQRCPETMAQRAVALLGQRGVTPLQTPDGLARISDIRMQPPLPETADELCAVARDLRADPADIRLGGSATERAIKALSASGGLAHYRVVHFATHGTLAGQLDGTSEPGLLLTPPAKASADDDGYLSASEIAGLKLDADWVILSACNTAAGGALGAQALSGLARAFIYAQTRALLVSHWAVDSNATVKLITSAIGEMAGDRKVGRSEALRRAMLSLIDNGAPAHAHPAYWAPFIVVGEGGR
jgi:CHAT domain-containing protein/tetratricopeptide (TPR) repeat protein